VLHPGCFWCWNLLFGKDNARARQSLGPPEKKVRSRGSPPMSVASTGAGAGAEQLSLEKPAFFYKFAPRLGTLIGGSHFFLLPLGVLYHLQKTTKLFFCFFSTLRCRRRATFTTEPEEFEQKCLQARDDHWGKPFFSYSRWAFCSIYRKRQNCFFLFFFNFFKSAACRAPIKHDRF
jgi:hypothetical protein